MKTEYYGVGGCAMCGFPVYVAPPQRTAAEGKDTRRAWVGLTNEQWNSCAWSPDFRAGAEWAEAKLKEKNT